MYICNLDLFFVASSDVRDSPAGFFLDALFVVIGQQAQQAWECTVLNNTLHKQPLLSKMRITYLGLTIKD
ncbi:hypothetical protein HanXRQr2_Chr13g0579671 [Helianthus annuus]|uniref:Uncharacterized protein n=1 Tax=Helianthus annuus TaxID=4232 RepID=A0A9K3HBA9_HELAN|nr:hypothetical protein HanXRQr2_Chr13g0579671 [Helianthus annuus]KAJ0848472.1 hypothetical protein HanPSC8_Chr13g0557851 [Helianthus annuus]